MTALTLRGVLAALSELPDDVREKVLDYDLVTEGCDCFGDVGSIEIEHRPDGGLGTLYLNRSSEEDNAKRNASEDRPYEQFPFGVGPRQKPYWWDEMQDLKARGLLPE